MSRTILLVVAGGMALMATTAYVASPKSSKTQMDLSKARFMHCPKCKREKMYTPRDFDNPCQYCEKRLVATQESITQSGSTASPYGRLYVLLFAELIVVLAVLWYLTRKRSGEALNEYWYFNCPKCHQKLRYRERQVGQSAQCRRCRKSFLYPPASHEEYVD